MARMNIGHSANLPMEVIASNSIQQQMRVKEPTQISIGDPHATAVETAIIKCLLSVGSQNIISGPTVTKEWIRHLVEDLHEKLVNQHSPPLRINNYAIQ